MHIKEYMYSSTFIHLTKNENMLQVVNQAIVTPGNAPNEIQAQSNVTSEVNQFQQYTF